MPNISPIRVTANGTQTFSNFPRYLIEFQITSSVRGDSTVLVDKTGANAVRFPQDLAALTEAKRIEMLRHLTEWFIQQRLEEVG